MKILVVSHEFPPIGGGGANACYYLTKGFAEKGHHVTLVTANYQNMPQKEIFHGVNIIRVHSLRKHREHSSFMEMLSYLVKALPVVLRAQKKEKFDVCLVFFGIPSGPLGYILKRKCKLPYIIRFGGGDVPGAQERFAKIYKLLGPVIKAIWRNADALVANSQGLRERALNFYSQKDFLVINNGVDIDIFYPIDKENTDEFRILFVSRLIEGKGLQYIIPELKKIQENADKKIRLIVVGDGPYRNCLEEVTKKYGMDSIVQFEGHKSRDELLVYYQSADVFILPSKQEGMPNVVLEAMACGLPIIMTPCEGSSELVQGNGMVISKEYFVEEIVRMYKDGALRSEMSRKSRQIAVERFSWEYIVGAYLKMFMDLLSAE